MSRPSRGAPRACSLFQRRDGLSFGYKVLSRHHLVQHGKTPLVLVTGLSAVGLIDWFPLASHLAKERTVLVFDNRGIGSSTIPSDQRDVEYTVQDMARDVVELIQHLGWHKIDILGFSMGGMIVQQLLVSERLPFKVQHAVLAATSAKRAHSDLLKAIPQGGAAASGKELTRDDKRRLVEPFTYVNYSPDFVKNPNNRKLLDQRIDESIDSRRPARTVQQQVAVIAGYDVRKKLGSIPSTLPVLVLHGTLDRSVYYTEAKYILEGIKHAKLKTFDNVGHMWYDYYTVEFWAHLLHTFLNDPNGGDVGELNPRAPLARL